MEKKDTLAFGQFYEIVVEGNNKEALFFAPENYPFFKSLLQKYLIPIADLYAYVMTANRILLLIRMREADDIPEKYHNRLYQPFSNMLNSYCKAVNNRYSRSGSLFRARFKRNHLASEDVVRATIGQMHLSALNAKAVHSSFYIIASEPTDGGLLPLRFSQFGNGIDFSEASKRNPI